jgi:hypothetical protein
MGNTFGNGTVSHEHLAQNMENRVLIKVFTTVIKKHRKT